MCLALYPFTFGFPLETIQRDTEGELLEAVEHQAIEQIEKTITAGDIPEVVTKVKLRRVLLLQTGTDAHLHDVLVARVTSVSDSMRTRARWYERMQRDQHPTSLLLGTRAAHGTNGVEAFANMINVSPISKTAILRRVGQLDDEEMRKVTDRLITSLEMDISHRLEAAS